MRAEQVVELDDRMSYSIDLIIYLQLFLSRGLLATHSTIIPFIRPKSLSILLYRHLNSGLIITVICLTTILLSIGRIIVILIPNNIDDELGSCKSHTIHIDIIQACSARLPFPVG